MMGIPISSPSYIYGDNMSVIYNTSKPELVSRKKSNSVCYHAVCESVAMVESLVGHMPSKDNITDLMKEVLYGQKRRYFVSNILYVIHDNHQLSVLARTEYNKASLIPLIIGSTSSVLERCIHR